MGVGWACRYGLRIYGYARHTPLPDNGEKHHSQGTEVPFVILAGDKVKLNIARRRYRRLPNYNEEGHKTLGN